MNSQINVTNDIFLVELLDIDTRFQNKNESIINVITLQLI